MMNSFSGRDSMRCSIFLCTLLCISSLVASAQDRAQRAFLGRDRPRHRGHQPGVGLASWGARFWLDGGPPIDAAIVANAVLGVTGPDDQKKKRQLVLLLIGTRRPGNFTVRTPAVGHINRLSH